MKEVREIDFEFRDDFKPTETSTEIFTLEEIEFQKLCKNYFKSTNVVSYKNMKLQLRHLPRFWKSLREKQG